MPSEEQYTSSYSQYGYVKTAVVPAKVADALQLKNKDKILWTVRNGQVVVQKKELIIGKSEEK